MAIDDLKNHVEENSDSNKSSGKTTFRVDRSVANKCMDEVGVSQNKQFTPVLEASILEYFGFEDEADEKVEEFKQQFED